MIYGFYRWDVAGRPPARAGAAAAGEKSLADPSHSRIIAHSFARTHDTCTKPKQKSISRLGPPYYTCAYSYTPVPTNALT